VAQGRACYQGRSRPALAAASRRPGVSFSAPRGLDGAYFAPVPAGP